MRCFFGLESIIATDRSTLVWRYGYNEQLGLEHFEISDPSPPIQKMQNALIARDRALESCLPRPSLNG